MFHHWWPQVRRWALYTCGDAVLADDAAQDALVRLLRHLPSWDPARPLGPWLRQIVRRAGIDMLAARSRDAARLQTLDDLSAHSSTPGVDRALDLAQEAARAKAAFTSLTPRQREALTLVDLDGLTAVEAAQRMAIEPSAVRAHLTQGRRALRTWLLRRGHDVRLLLQETA